MGPCKEAPQQHTQPSRKGKKAWRKNVDVTELQAGLEEARQEVIEGGIIAEKHSESLFTLDTKGSEAIQKSYNKLHKPLKADQILAQRSAVPAIDGRKRSGVTDGVLQPSSKKRKNDVTPTEYDRLRGVAYGSQTVKDIIKSDDTPDHDPWAVNQAEEEKESQFSYLEKRKPIKAPVTLKEAPICLITGSRNVPAVPAPKPGTSYNPAFQDWEALLAAEGQREIEAEKKRRREAELEQGIIDRRLAAEIERDADIQTEDESAWEGFESDYDGAEWSKKRRPERKTPAERNKVKRRKEVEKREKWEKKMMMEREKQQRQIGEIARQVNSEMKAKALVKAKLEDPKEVDYQVLRRRRLGNDALAQPPLELVLPEELRESLRLLKPEGNLLKDRFRNLLVSGKMETRKRIQQPKKKRVSYTEKWSHKDWNLAI